MPMEHQNQCPRYLQLDHLVLCNLTGKLKLKLNQETKLKLFLGVPSLPNQLNPQAFLWLNDSKRKDKSVKKENAWEKKRNIRLSLSRSNNMGERCWLKIEKRMNKLPTLSLESSLNLKENRLTNNINPIRTYEQNPQLKRWKPILVMCLTIIKSLKKVVIKPKQRREKLPNRNRSIQTTLPRCFS